jgi:hypothetical protein
MNRGHESLRRGLIGAWCPSLGATGYALIDRSPYARHGTLTNMGGQTNWRPYSRGSALSLDGTNDYVAIGRQLLSGMSVCTVSLWGVPTSTSNRVEVSEGTNNTTRATYGLAEDGNAYVLPASTAGYGYCNWSALGSLIHYVGVFNAGGAANADRAKIYLNGVQRSVTFIGTVPSSAGTFTNNFLLGVRPDLTAYSSGLIDDVRVYNRELTTAEIGLLASRPGIGLVPQRQRRTSASSKRLYLQVGGTWKETLPFVNVGGTWKEAAVYQRNATEWKN